MTDRSYWQEQNVKALARVDRGTVDTPDQVFARLEHARTVERVDLSFDRSEPDPRLLRRRSMCGGKRLG
jgi:hypothetical protein